MALEERKAVYQIDGQVVSYLKKESFTGPFLTDSMGVYTFEFRFSQEWKDFSKITLFVKCAAGDSLAINITDPANGKAEASDTGVNYKVLVPAQMLFTPGKLTVGFTGYKKDDVEFRFPTNTDSSYTVTQAVPQEYYDKYPQSLTILEEILLKIDDIEHGTGTGITVDSALSATSANPIQNKAVAAEFAKYVKKEDITGGSYADSEIKSDLQSIKDVIYGEPVESNKSVSGNTFDDLGYVDGSISVTSTSSVDVFTHGKNYLPFTISSFDSNLTKVSETEDSVTFTIKKDATFKHIKFKPIFLKSGTYTVSRKIETLSGSSIANAGTVYIYTGDTESEQTTNLKVFNIESQTITLNSDNWVMVDVYANTNSTVSADTTLRLSQLQIERSASYTGYEKYKGARYTGTDLTVKHFDGMGMYSTGDIDVSYTELIPTGETYSEIKEKLEATQNDVVTLKNAYNGVTKLVVCDGDSLTSGTGHDTAKPSTELNTDNSYPAVLGRKLGDEYTVINAGVGGEPSWMIAARQGGMPVKVLPTTIPADKTSVRVYLKGEEQDCYYNADTSAWTYVKGALSYNIAVEGNARINPCKINGIEGTLTRELVSSGSPDPTTGETVQANTYAYYFTRSEAGEASTFRVPKDLVTYAAENYKEAVHIIWAGQNDAPKINDKYFTQIGTHNRIRRMIESTNSKKYIVMQTPSSSDERDTKNDITYIQEFGDHYINIRKFICDYGIELAESMGYTVTRDQDNCYVGDAAVDTTYPTVGESIDAGVIPRVFRKDGVHGNYYYYQMVAMAVYEKGKDLGYW